MSEPEMSMREAAAILRRMGRSQGIKIKGIAHIADEPAEEDSNTDDQVAEKPQNNDSDEDTLQFKGGQTQESKTGAAAAMNKGSQDKALDTTTTEDGDDSSGGVPVSSTDPVYDDQPLVPGGQVVATSQGNVTIYGEHVIISSNPAAVEEYRRTRGEEYFAKYPELKNRKV